MTRRGPEGPPGRQPGDRTGVGFALAVFLGVVVGVFLDSVLGVWSIAAGVVVAMAADYAIRALDRHRAGRGDRGTGDRP